jgi:hypothetical protein
MKSIWERLFGKGEPQRQAEPANDRDDLLDDIHEQVRRDVTAGFYDEDEILRGAIDMYEGEIDASLAASHARQCLAEALAAHAEAQKSWPAATDCDRLDAAFTALDANGIISRQHFSCCGNCGSHEIWDEIDTAKAEGRPARGYAFYHVQDTEAAVDGYGIYLNYGACDEGEAAAVAVGQDIVAVLEGHGLKTDWNGSWDKRIGVELDWKRRR